MDEPKPDSAQTRRLLEKCRAGDREAFEQLFARHRSFLRKVVDLRLDDELRVRIDPSDIVQETHLEAFRRLEDYMIRQPMPFHLWLRRTACQQVATAQRRHLGAKRRSLAKEVSLPDRSSLHLAEQLLAHSSTPSREATRRELAQQVRSALAKLSEVDREILIMRNLEMLSNSDAAQALEIDPAAASQRYGRALLRLRQLFVKGKLGESQS
jgi:RNA polymerase sigma-70 factor (ECF subfamily)